MDAALTLAAALASTCTTIWNFAQGILANHGHTFSEENVAIFKRWLSQGKLPANHHLLKASREAWKRAVHIVASQIAKDNAMTTTWWTSFRQRCRSRFRMRDWSRDSRLDLEKPGAEWLAELIHQLDTPSFEEWHSRVIFALCPLEEVLAADPANPHAARTAESFLRWIHDGIELGDFNDPPCLAEYLHGKTDSASLWVLHGIELREILTEDESIFRGYMVQTTRRLISEMKRTQAITAAVAGAATEDVEMHGATAFSVDALLTPLAVRFDSVDAWLEKLGGKLDVIQTQTSLLPQIARDISDLLRSPGLDLHRYARRVLTEYGPVPVSRIDFDSPEAALQLRDVFEEPDVRSFGLDEVHIHEVPHEAKPNDDTDPSSGRDTAVVWKDRVDKLFENHTSQTPVPVSSVLRDPQHRGHIILGDPGAGKTALLRFLTVTWAQRFIESNAGHERIPIYIELKHYVEAYSRDRKLSLTDYLHEGTCGMATGMDCSRVQELLRSGAAILLLDGLDEIIDESVREQVAWHIRDLYEQGFGIVLTSRIYGFKSAGWRDLAWQGWMLQPFDEKKRTSFMQQCHRVFFNSAAEFKFRLDRLQRKLKEFHHMAELASNPLLLTLLCLINRRSGALPENRTQLYESAARLMIYDWDAGHFGESGAALGYDLKPLTLDQKHDLLRHIAWRVSTEGDGISTNLITRRALTDEIVRFMRDYPQLGEPERYAERLIAQLRERSFVLCYAGGDFYSFVHRTFLEFYCAWAWTEHPAAESLSADELWQRLILERWHQERWPIIISLTFAKLRTDVADRFLRDLQTMEAAGRPCAGLLLAAECLAETKKRAAHNEQADRISRRLLRIASSRYPFDGTSLALDIKNNSLRCSAAEAFSLNWPEDRRLSHSLLSIASSDEVHPAVRRRAIGILMQTSGLNAESRAILLKIAKNDGTNVSVRIDTFSTLAGIDGMEVDVLDHLLAIASDSKFDVSARISAFRALGKAGLALARVRSGLLEMAKDGRNEDPVRSLAFATLGRIFGADAEVHAGLLGIARNNDNIPYIRTAAIRVLGETGGPLDGLLELARSRDTHPNIRSTALTTLSQITGTESEIRPALREIARDQDTAAWVRLNAFESLLQIDHTDTEVRAGILEIAQNREINPLYRVRAYAVLGRVGGADAEARDGLSGIASESDIDNHVRKLAIETLVQIGGAIEELLGRFRTSSCDSDIEAAVSIQAFSALGHANGEKAEILTRLLNVVGNPDATTPVRINAFAALGQIGGLDTKVRIGLLEIARDTEGSDYDRHSALEALEQLVSAEAAVRAGLLEIARECNSNEIIRGEALGLLCWLWPEDEEIQEALVVFEATVRHVWS